jgi:transketolase
MNATGTLHQRARYLEGKAGEIRAEILKMIHSAQSGHPGGSLSAADIMAALYFDILNIRPDEPEWTERDRFVLSKGHACPVWYATLALRGYFPVDELKTLRQFETRLQGHPVQGKCPGVDATTGSLGIGFAQAVGMALDSRLRSADWKVYTVLGDGETNEGIVWEAAGTANKYRLDNLVAVIDRNNLQNDGTADAIMPMEPLEDKFRAFNWHAMRIDGHDMDQILNALIKARDHVGKPVVIIADTVKGKGVSYMENVRGWHGKPPNDEQLVQALKDVGGTSS